MSRIQNVVAIFDAFLSRRDKVDLDQSMGHEFDVTCKSLFGVDSGLEFISDFAALVAQLEEDVVRVPYLRDEQRIHYTRQLEPLRTLFGSKTYFLPWKQLFQQMTEGNLRNSLLLMDPLLDTQQSRLRQMPDRAAIKAELADLERTLEQSKLGADIKRLLLFEINKMRTLLQNEKSFKETRIWEQYQKLTAQLMAAVLDLHDGERANFRAALLNLTRRVRESLGLVPDAPSLSDPSLKVPFVDWNEPA